MPRSRSKQPSELETIPEDLKARCQLFGEINFTDFCRSKRLLHDNKVEDQCYEEAQLYYNIIRRPFRERADIRFKEELVGTLEDLQRTTILVPSYEYLALRRLGKLDHLARESELQACHGILSRGDIKLYDTAMEKFMRIDLSESAGIDIGYMVSESFVDGHSLLDEPSETCSNAVETTSSGELTPGTTERESTQLQGLDLISTSFLKRSIWSAYAFKNSEDNPFVASSEAQRSC
ncbi:hypothetical protein NliqN6_4022 [Naganishia liquefaciens]|uniref:Uncharacterized protein n=1 Tax=Naganishia liquefaciens TaxID=104408 RepID=A0A8H3TUS9_9TREE|nr:hypothetical protein NliqN6_4022 [Naganishia liquefaciens]